MVERTDPQLKADEMTTLVEFLDYYRATLMVKVDRLTDEQARRRACPPSSLNLMGLVRHMAEVERSWFRRVLVGEDRARAGAIFYTDHDPDLDMHPPAEATLAEAIAAWQGEIAIARRNTAATSPDTISPPSRRQDGRDEQFSLRWILVHMIEEYARHCGHADLLREAIDGEVGD